MELGSPFGTMKIVIPVSIYDNEACGQLLRRCCRFVIKEYLLDKLLVVIPPKTKVSKEVIDCLTISISLSEIVQGIGEIALPHASYGLA